MFRLATQTLDTATGKVAEFFGMFPPQIGLPVPLMLLSASPGLMAAQMGIIGYYRGQTRLSFELLSAIRFLAAREFEAPDCQDFNRRLLVMAGLSEAEIDALPDSGGAFSEPERALLGYCVVLIREPGSITDADIAVLRGHGWTDADIMDASMQASNMQALARLLRALKR
jgi:alkylhydroperoxidase family enzyme